MDKKLKILIVDDKKGNLVALRQVLSDVDAEIVEATSGNQALTTTLIHNFSLAILDVQMPAMDGYELAELLRGDLKTANMPIIFMTATYGAEIDIFKGYEAGAVDYIVKPYKPAVLRAKVRIFLDLQHAQKELARRVLELSASEERFRTLVTTIPDIVYRIDNEGRFTFLNNAVRSLGYSPEELIGIPFAEIVMPADVENVSRRFVLPRFAGKSTGDEGAPKLFDERRMGSRQTLTMEVRLVSRRAGRAVPAELNSGGRSIFTAEVNSSGLYGNIEGLPATFLGTVGIIRDISQRKKAEDELSRYRQGLEKMVEEQTVELKKRVKETNCLYAVSNLFAKQSQSIDEALKSAADLIPKCWQHPEVARARIVFEDREFTSEGFRETPWKLSADIVLSRMTVGTVETCYLEEMPALGERSFLKEEQDLIDELARQFAVMIQRERNEEEREMLYDELKTLNIELENKVEERTKELELAFKQADEANLSKSEFLANMSHEIRTPMNAILGLTHLALRTRISPKQEDYLQKIEFSGKSLLQIINDILDFSKIEAGKLDVEKVGFKLEEILNNVGTIVSFEAQKKKIEFNFDVDPDIPLIIEGDPIRLGQILSNLCNNAIKFTATGQILVSVSTVYKNEKEVTLRFSIKDTGIGMSDTQIKKLFQPFMQADSSTTRKFGGTGLGLAICKRLVELMGGEIGIVSKLGKGSEFFFTVSFPISSKSVKAQYSISPDIQGMKVLVVDDNYAARKMLSRMLEKMTFEVSTVNDGEEAVLKVEQADEKRSPFKLVISDWKMPDINGIETIRRIKTNNKISHIPKAILISGFEITDTDEDIKDACIDGILTKPTTSSSLFDLIMECFGIKESDVPSLQDGLSVIIENERKIRGAKILLAEDNEINQQVAREILENKGLVVTVANTGTEAVKMVVASQFDAVLMDIQMPVMDGYTATRKIREWERSRNQKMEDRGQRAGDRGQETEDRGQETEGRGQESETAERAIRNIPIIAMTAHAMTGDREKCLAAGLNDYITKPINHNKLFAALVKWIEPCERQAPLPRKELIADAVDVVLPEILPGIDLKDGLIRVAGNQKLFKQLLVKFSDSHKNSVEEILSALESKNREKAIRIAHTLRGLAGTLGAYELQAAAADLESALTGGNEELNELLEHMSGALKQVLSGIVSLEDGESENRPAAAETIEAVDLSRVAQLQKELSVLLKKNDMRSETVFEEIKDQLYIIQPDKTKLLKEHISNFNFKSALKELKIIIGSTKRRGRR